MTDLTVTDPYLVGQYPPGVSTRPVHLGGAVSVEAGVPLTAHVVTESSRALIHRATGWRLEKLAHSSVSPLTGELVWWETATTDRSEEYLDAETRQVIVLGENEHTHLYTTTLTVYTGDVLVGEYTVGPYPVPTGDGSTYDLDTNLIPDETSEGTLVPIPELWIQIIADAQVIAGLRGEPDGIAELDGAGKVPDSQLPGRLSSTSLDGRFLQLNNTSGVVGDLLEDRESAARAGFDAAFADAISQDFATIAESLTKYQRAVPAYVTAAGDVVDYEYSADLRLFYESSADMYAMRRDLGLTRASTGAIQSQILCIGDSKTWGRGVGFPTYLRDMLGALDGMVYAQGAGHTYPDSRWTDRSGFTLAGTQLYLTAAANATSQAELTFTRRSNGLRVWYYHTGSIGAQTVTVDGGTPVTLAPTGTRIPAGLSNGWHYMDITGLTDVSHKVRISATTTGGSFWLLGFEALHTGQAVTTVINAGISSSTVANWLPGSTSQLNAFNASPGLLQAGPERKIAIVQLGTNASADEVANYRATVIRLRELGYSVLNVAPGGTATTGARGTMKRGQYLAAQELSMPLVDFTDLIGDNVTAAARGFMVDTLHENERGYRLEASILQRVLNAA